MCARAEQMSSLPCSVEVVIVGGGDGGMRAGGRLSDTGDAIWHNSMLLNR
ncbi:hypothetical protein [Paenibacillus allorhizoplanae]|nr:hypothetical protein [Paenibacillus allorhizoplanae]